MLEEGSDLGRAMKDLYAAHLKTLLGKPSVLWDTLDNHHPPDSEGVIAMEQKPCERCGHAVQEWAIYHPNPTRHEYICELCMNLAMLSGEEIHSIDEKPCPTCEILYQWTEK